ncbi:hypothetical protein [uncultured Chryseobacterium sp.]|uniref:hypothetical protein n=1 Tax=uncultured Chryseobacterium sp. TaxID=259322 RepID=UPI0025EEA300|nr:hypothetical protein [uncultured Chryseobacterium sp.]
MKNNYSILQTLFLFSVQIYYCQVGINTTTPKATLEIVGKNSGGVVDPKDGIIIPRVNQVSNVSGTANSQLVYLTANDGSLVPGFIFWDGAAWKQLGGGSLTLSNFSAVSPLAYNNVTGAFSIFQAGSSGNGYLSSADWNIFNNKQNALIFSTGFTNTANTITLNPATASTIGGIKVGNGLNVASDGTISVPSNVSSFSTGTTGLTPSTLTSGAVTLAGTLKPSNGGTGNITVPAVGTLLQGDGTIYQTLLPGTAGQVLTSGGAGNALSWSTPFTSNTAEIYDAAGTQTFATAAGFTTMLITSAGVVDSGYTAGSGTITVTNTGKYKVTYRISASVTTNSQATGEYKLQVNGNDVAGTSGFTFHRNNADPRGSVTVIKILNLNANDILRVQGKVWNTTNRSLQLVANGSSLIVEKM